MSNLLNYQEQGLAKDLKEANAKISQYRNSTPAHLRENFRSNIEYAGKGKYYWCWILKG